MVNSMLRLTGLAIVCSGCLVPAQTGSKPAAAANRPVVTPENRLVLMPYGQYKGAAPFGTATLDLQNDQKFVLHWQAKLPSGIVREGQWNGTFEWLRNDAGFESIAFFDVREAIDGKIADGMSDKKQAVTSIDTEKQAFAIKVPDLDTVEFKPAK